MSLHPSKVKELVDAGQSVIFQGRVINKRSGSALPSASELAGDDVLRSQFAVELEREIKAKQDELAKLKGTPEVVVVSTGSTEVAAPGKGVTVTETAPPEEAKPTREELRARARS